MNNGFKIAWWVFACSYEYPRIEHFTESKKYLTAES